MDRYQELHAKLAAAGQQQLLRFWSQLDADQQARLAGSARRHRFRRTGKADQRVCAAAAENADPGGSRPGPLFPAGSARRGAKGALREGAGPRRRAAARGAGLLRPVAGGQGTRLGFDGPKGTYPIAPVTGKSLFQYFAESILRTGEKFGCRLTWYIMTSLLNREATEAFFKEHAFFGLAPEQVFFFTQGTMPAIGYDGKLLLAEKDSLSLSPNGHGGTLLALRKSGALARMEAEKTDCISYFQVDNPLIPVVNPFFLGMHDLEKSEMSAIMLAKTGRLKSSATSA